jgi:hypothetical protein
LCALFLKETYAKTILSRKAAALRRKTGDGQYVSVLADKLPSSALLKNAFIRPLKILFLSPVVFLLSTHLAVAYGYLVRGSPDMNLRLNTHSYARARYQTLANKFSPNSSTSS